MILRRNHRRIQQRVVTTAFRSDLWSECWTWNVYIRVSPRPLHTLCWKAIMLMIKYFWFLAGICKRPWMLSSIDLSLKPSKRPERWARHPYEPELHMWSRRSLLVPVVFYFMSPWILSYSESSFIGTAHWSSQMLNGFNGNASYHLLCWCDAVFPFFERPDIKQAFPFQLSCHLTYQVANLALKLFTHPCIW